MSDKRKLTPFLAHEMLFDFATGQLDPDRKQAIENFVREDVESKNLLEAIRRGIAYSESLRAIDLTDATIQELDQSENFVSLSKRLARWSEWPDSLRWSIMALAISICTAAVVVAIPWKSVPLFKTGPSFDSGTVEIARVDPRKVRGDDQGGVAEQTEETKENETGPLEGSGDEEFSDDGSVPAVVAGPRPAPVRPPIETNAGWKPVPTPRADVKPTPVVVGANSAAPGTTATPALAPNATHAAPTAAAGTSANAKPVAKPMAVATQAPAASSKASRSFVYRAFMTLSDLENIAPKITQQIKELGAEKAGEVELGWRRGSGRYYHFTIPESNEQKLLENLRVYGPVRISKDPHPRVMPEGQVRFILWIESGS